MKKLNYDKLNENLDKRILGDINNNIIPGACVFVYQEGQKEYFKNYGSSKIDEMSPMTEKNVFRIASMSKPITAVAVLREIEKGNIDLFDYVETFLPEFKDLYLGKSVDDKIIKTTKVTNRPRIIHLLTHTSGIGTDEIAANFWRVMTRNDRINLDTMIAFYTRQPLLFEPGSRSFYSSLAAFEILGKIIEVVSGKKFDQYLKEEIFDKIGMVDTTFEPNDDQLARLVDMHMLVDGKNVKRRMFEGCAFEDVPYSVHSGGAGLVSTCYDYSLFAKMLLNKGLFNGNRILEEKTVKSLSLSHVPDNILCGEKWSLGMRTISDPSYGRLEVGTFGWSGAYGTHFWVDPKNRVCAVYMKNSAYDGGAGAITSAHFESDVTDSLE